MRLSGVFNNLAIPMPEQFRTASSLAAPRNSPPLREAHAFGVKILRFAKTWDGGFPNTAAGPHRSRTARQGRKAREAKGRKRNSATNEHEPTPDPSQEGFGVRGSRFEV